MPPRKTSFAVTLYETEIHIAKQFQQENASPVSYDCLRHAYCGERVNQDQIWLEKIGVYVGFCLYRGSWLVWSPVLFLGAKFSIPPPK